jgi:2',3'-cyclic-nucleotide 2'-phosphodiesterase (5'-nucleotidase family)
VNDTHGALEDGKFSKIAAYFSSQDSNTSLFLSAGDMFQGTALSNYTQGRAMIRAMNAAGFDAMTIGNHEFDWGLDAIQVYWDGDDSNGEADFPLLGANVYAKATNQRLPWLQDYEIFEREGLKFGVIGVLAMGFETSTAYPMVQGL